MILAGTIDEKEAPPDNETQTNETLGNESQGNESQRNAPMPASRPTSNEPYHMYTELDDIRSTQYTDTVNPVGRTADNKASEESSHYIYPRTIVCSKIRYICKFTYYITLKL